MAIDLNKPSEEKEPEPFPINSRFRRFDVLRKSKRKAKVPVETTQFEVFRRMINYSYEIKEDKPKELKRIEEIATKNGELKVLDSKKTHMYGWLLKEHFEEKDCPYPIKHPGRSRYAFLDHKPPEKEKKRPLSDQQLTEKSQFGYKTNKGKINRPPVWRLRRDASSCTELYKIFFEKHSILEFIQSDYYKDVFVKKFPQSQIIKGLYSQYNKNTQTELSNLFLPPTFVYHILKHNFLIDIPLGCSYVDILLSFLIHDYITLDYAVATDAHESNWKEKIRESIRIAKLIHKGKRR